MAWSRMLRAPNTSRKHTHIKSRPLTIVILAVRPKEEGRALQRRARHAELLDLRNIRRERCGVLVRLRGLGRVEISAHDGSGVEAEWMREVNDGNRRRT